jgi:hypothetical protein
MAKVTTAITRRRPLFGQEDPDSASPLTASAFRARARGAELFTTGQSRFKTAGTIPVVRLDERWKRAKEGLRFAINFRRANGFSRICSATL